MYIYCCIICLFTWILVQTSEKASEPFIQAGNTITDVQDTSWSPYFGQFCPFTPWVTAALIFQCLSIQCSRSCFWVDQCLLNHFCYFSLWAESHWSIWKKKQSKKPSEAFSGERFLCAFSRTGTEMIFDFYEPQRAVLKYRNWSVGKSP